MKQFVIATGRTVEQLEHDVNDFIDNGYVPIGSIVKMDTTDDGLQYCLQMLRPEETI